jgi:hypothetical protein
MLSVIMLNVIMLAVVMLNVMEPHMTRSEYCKALITQGESFIRLDLGRFKILSRCHFADLNRPIL